MRSFYTQSGVRLRALRVTDDRNDVVLDWTTSTSLAVTGVRLQPLDADEIRPGRTGEVLTHRLLTGFGVDILADDRWVQDGQTFDVDASPRRQHSPNDLAAHGEVFLRQVNG